MQELPSTGEPPTTPADQVTREGNVILDQLGASGQVIARYRLGPVLLDGTIIGSAHAVMDQSGQWRVDFTTTPAGSPAFDQLAAETYLHQVAVVFDDTVLATPTVNATAFHGSAQVTGMCTQAQAQQVAEILNTSA